MIERKLLQSILSHLDSSEAIVITGMRRVGKTTLMRLVFDRLKTANKIFLDLENPINQKYFEKDDYEAVAYNLSVLGANLQERSFIFLDEIQFCKNLPSVVKYLSDHYPIKFFLTGSASFYLKNLFSESLAGRKYLFELYPLDFEEFLAFKKETARPPAKGRSLPPELHARFQTFYQEYVEFGGFPQVVAKSDVKEKQEALKDIFSSYFNKEILQLGDFRNNQIVRDLMLLLLERIGSRLEIQKIASELGVSRPTLKEYLAFLEGTYFINFVYPFSRSRDVEIRGAPKIYCIDSGLANQLAKVEFGHIFENAVFHQLRLRAKNVNYYRKKTGAEIDFVIDKEAAYEVKLTATLRDQNNLKRLANELKLEKIALVSYKFNQLKDVCYGFQL